MPRKRVANNFRTHVNTMISASLSASVRLVPIWVLTFVLFHQSPVAAQNLHWPRAPQYSGPSPVSSEKPPLMQRIRGLFSFDQGNDSAATSDSSSEWKGVLRSHGNPKTSERRSKSASRNNTSERASSRRQTPPDSSAPPFDSVPHFEEDESTASVIPLSAVAPAQDTRQGKIRVAGWNLQQPVQPPQPGPAPVVAEEDGIVIPLPASSGRATITQTGELVSLDVAGAPITEVLTLIARQHDLNVVASADVTGDLSVNLKNVSLDEALTAILKINGYTWKRDGNILIVSAVNASSTTSAMMQGRQVRVFPLTYISAEDASTVVTGLLSPVGKAFVTQSSASDKRKTQEQLVVEDLPEYLERIESYIYATDNAPKQVLIEAHVLRVELTDSTRHGVDFAALLRIAGSETVLATQGFTSPTASPAFFLSVDGTDFAAILEALKSTTDAKTLASPKVLAVNGQEAKIQIGARLGYLVTTTTQTSTLQNVEFLETGIVLNVTPIIGRDHQILMNVKPEISAGRVNPDTGLPEEETTEVQTTVMLQDGHAMIIGGLISEADIEQQSKIPVLGDLWGIGRAFQRRSVERERTEIIIALIPRVVPYSGEAALLEECQKARVQIPLLHGALNRVDRTAFEPKLPDAVDVPRRADAERILNSVHDLNEPRPRPLDYYFPLTEEPPFED